MKKIIVLAVSVLMVAALALPALAADLDIGPTPDGSTATMHQNTVGNTKLTHYTVNDSQVGTVSSSVNVDYANDVITLNGAKVYSPNILYNMDRSGAPLEWVYTNTWMAEVEVALDKAIQDSKDVTIEFEVSYDACNQSDDSNEVYTGHRFAVMMSDDNGGFQMKNSALWPEAIVDQFTAAPKWSYEGETAEATNLNGGTSLKDTFAQSWWWISFGSEPFTVKMVRSGDKVTVTATAKTDSGNVDYSIGIFDCKGKTALKFCSTALTMSFKNIKVNGAVLDLNDQAVVDWDAKDDNAGSADTADFTSAAIVAVVVAAGAAVVFSKRKHG